MTVLTGEKPNKLNIYLIALALLGITVFSLLYQGVFFGLGATDHSIHIPIVKSLNNPQLYPADLFVKTAPQYFTFFWRFVAVAVRVLPMEPLFLTLHFLFRLLWVVTIYYLARVWSLDQYSALIGVCFLITAKVFLNFSPLPEGLIHSEAAWPFLLLSMAAFWREKYIIAAVLAGLTFNLHPLLTAYLMVIYLGLLVYKLSRDYDFELVKTLLLCGFLFLLLTTPTLYWMNKTLQGSTRQSGQWLALNLVRHKHFSAPGTWSVTIYIQTLYLVLIFWLGSQSRPLPERKTWLIYGAAILAMVLIGIPLFGWQMNSFMLKAQFIRSLLFLYFPAFLLMAAFLAEKYRRYSRTWLAPFIFLSILGLIFHGPNNFSTNLVCLSGGLIPLLGGLYYLERKPLFLTLGIAAVILSIIGFLNISGQVNWWLTGGIISGAAALSLADRFKTNRYGSSAGILVFCGILGALLFSRYQANQEFKRSFQSWKKIQLWARENTPLKSVFIIPPALEGWHIYSERSDVIDWKVLTSIHWAPENADEWVRRLKDFGYDLERDADKDLRTALRDEYRKLSPADFLRLGRKYGAAYVITAYPRSLPFSKIYQNSTFRIYHLPGKQEPWKPLF